ncbi:unnamed protein product [Prunus armeniaca]|uniref:Uncharacterized protein n=1 Tax=Prunus armeniaca TaxID=36596 RepID=A0A6J5UMC4_PRUAR|nr:unnamed protein product [Prunus armeniaca]
MLLGMLPDNWLFDKSRVVTAFNFPISSEIDPFRKLYDKPRNKISSRLDPTVPMAIDEGSPIPSSVNSQTSSQISQTSQNSILSMSATIPTSFNISHIFNTPMDHNNFQVRCLRPVNDELVNAQHQLQAKMDFQSLRMRIAERLDALRELLPISTEDVVKNENRPAKRLEEGSINPTYAKDKLVLSWIKATESLSVKTLLISCTSAYEASTLLEKRLSPLSKTHLRTLCDQIRSMKKEPEKTMTQYCWGQKVVHLIRLLLEISASKKNR